MSRTALLPFALLFIVFLIFPLGRSFYYSLTDFNGIKAPEFVGFQNFTELIASDDRYSWCNTCGRSPTTSCTPPGSTARANGGSGG